MFINEVEHKVGLSKKSIRYYEENGLLNPRRGKENDYRIYEEEDIRKLKVIKFLRELGVSIRDLKKLNEGNLSLNACMQERILKITMEEKNYKKVKNMCLEIMAKEETYQDIAIENYFQKMNILNKEGFTMREIKSSKNKKIAGAILSSFLFSFFFLFLVLIISYFQFTEVEKMPWVFYWFFLFLLFMPILGIGYNLVLRIKEIKGGEEDEASKY